MMTKRYGRSVSKIDPEAVQAFVLVAQHKSFTRAARALNSTQSAVSLKISRLEKRLDQRLFERTPRHVRLSAAGEAFLGPGTALAESYARAIAVFEEKPGRLVLGVSHHIVGDDLQMLLWHLKALDKNLILDLRLGPTRSLLDAYDQNQMDAVVILRHDESRRGGETLLTEEFGWMAAPDLVLTAGEPLPLLLQAEPCYLRALATTALRSGRIAWREAFLGTGVASVAAAALAGLGIAPISRRVAPAGLVDVGARLELPKLPTRPVVLHSNIVDPRAKAMLRHFCAAFRRSGPSRLVVAAE